MTGFSFSAAAWPVYGEKQPHADIARGMDVLDAAFLIAQECPGGVAGLAQRMGVSANTLQHKLNPNNTSHHLTLKEALALQVVSGLPYVLYAMSAALDHVCLRSRPDVADGDAWEAYRFFQQSIGELTAAAADALKGDRPTSANALRRVEHQANEAIAGISALVNAVGVRVPKHEG
ncbi:phage regulatory CII family protein [Comamonas aquatica]|uniref:phage regulatory CII family protein n=1 Tax=Comamonas aquatica TaxID=225991 RepID=UPI00244BEB9C|nr:phage regulatory CII family protein [Comamonas aquatica]MDH0371808.1 phage regulatory CII family protein [Comamonas aquatica]